MVAWVDSHTMRGPPTRQTRAATGSRRWTWHGMGTAVKTDKDGVGVFLDDVAYAFAEISLLGLPVLYAVMMGAELAYFGSKTGLFAAWTAMVVAAALIRGGWLTPLGTDVPGWVSLKPSLIGLRLVYYNAVMGGAAYLGGAFAAAGHPFLSVVCPVVVGAGAVGLFPAVADRAYELAS